jgi:hypothetical protein
MRIYVYINIYAYINSETIRNSYCVQHTSHTSVTWNTLASRAIREKHMPHMTRGTWHMDHTRCASRAIHVKTGNGNGDGCISVSASANTETAPSIQLSVEHTVFIYEITLLNYQTILI